MKGAVPSALSPDSGSGDGGDGSQTAAGDGSCGLVIAGRRGEGRETWYAGSWVAGERAGEGVQRFGLCGSTYDGAWRGGAPGGLGRMLWAGGAGGAAEEYAGEWQRGARTGFGVHCWRASGTAAADTRLAALAGGAAAALAAAAAAPRALVASLTQRLRAADAAAAAQRTERARHVGLWVGGARAGPGRLHLPGGEVLLARWDKDSKTGPALLIRPCGRSALMVFIRDGLHCCVAAGSADAAGLGPGSAGEEGLRAALAAAAGEVEKPPAVLPPVDERVGANALPSDDVLIALVARGGGPAAPAGLYANAATTALAARVRACLERWLPALRLRAAAAAAASELEPVGELLPGSGLAYLRQRLDALAAGAELGTLAAASPCLRRSALRRIIAEGGLLRDGASGAPASLAACDEVLQRLQAEATGRALHLLPILVRAGGASACEDALALATQLLRLLAQRTRLQGHAADDIIAPADWLALLVQLAVHTPQPPCPRLPLLSAQDAPLSWCGCSRHAPDANTLQQQAAGSGLEAALSCLLGRACTQAQPERQRILCGVEAAELMRLAPGTLRDCARRAAKHVAAASAAPPAPASSLGEALSLEAGSDSAASVAAALPLWQALSDLEAAAAAAGCSIIDRLLHAPLVVECLADCDSPQPAEPALQSPSRLVPPPPLVVSASALLQLLTASGVVDAGPLRLPMAHAPLLSTPAPLPTPSLPRATTAAAAATSASPVTAAPGRAGSRQQVQGAAAAAASAAAAAAVATAADGAFLQARELCIASSTLLSLQHNLNELLAACPRMMAGDALGIMHAVARDGGAVAVPPVLQSGSTGREPPLAACLPDGNGAELTPQAEEGGSATPLPPPPAPPHPPPPPLPLELLVDVDLPAVLVALSARRSMLHAPCQCWAVNAKERGATLLAAALPTLLSEVEAALQCAAPPLPPPPPLARGSGGRPVSPAARARVPTPEESAASSAVAASCAASVDAVAAAFEAALALAVVVVGGGDSGVDTGTVFGGPAGGEGGAAAAGKSAVLDRLEQWLDAEESARGTKEGRSVD